MKKIDAYRIDDSEHVKLSFVYAAESAQAHKKGAAGKGKKGIISNIPSVYNLPGSNDNSQLMLPLLPELSNEEDEIENKFNKNTGVTLKVLNNVQKRLKQKEEGVTMLISQLWDGNLRSKIVSSLADKQIRRQTLRKSGIPNPKKTIQRSGTRLFVSPTVSRPTSIYNGAKDSVSMRTAKMPTDYDLALKIERNFKTHIVNPEDSRPNIIVQNQLKSMGSDSRLLSPFMSKAMIAPFKNKSSRVSYNDLHKPEYESGLSRNFLGIQVNRANPITSADNSVIEEDNENEFNELKSRLKSIANEGKPLRQSNTNLLSNQHTALTSGLKAKIMDRLTTDHKDSMSRLPSVRIRGQHNRVRSDLVNGGQLQNSITYSIPKKYSLSKRVISSRPSVQFSDGGDSNLDKYWAVLDEIRHTQTDDTSTIGFTGIDLSKCLSNHPLLTGSKSKPIESLHNFNLQKRKVGHTKLKSSSLTKVRIDMELLKVQMTRRHALKELNKIEEPPKM